jgi:hypothetical protein
MRFVVLLQNSWIEFGGTVSTSRPLRDFAFAVEPVLRRQWPTLVDGTERYVFWVAPHIDLTLEGEVGKVFRPGREAASSACGAMIAVHNELKSGRLQVSLDPLDLEQSLLKQQLVNSLHYGHVPSLVELTYRAYETIFAEVQKLAAASTDPLKCEYVIVAGIQVHGPLGQNFFWPGTSPAAPPPPARAALRRSEV